MCAPIQKKIGGGGEGGTYDRTDIINRTSTYDLGEVGTTISWLELAGNLRSFDQADLGKTLPTKRTKT